MAGERNISDGMTKNFSRRQKITTIDKNGLVTIVETVRYTFSARDHGQMLSCIIAEWWIDVEKDKYLASAMLNVWFSQPQDPITLYGFVEGQTGDIAFNFTVNPSPTRAWWTLEDDGRIDVPIGLANFSPTDKPSNYEAYPLEPINGSQPTYEARLRLKSITKQQADMVYRLSVESILRDQFHKQEYTVHISVDPAPLTDSNEASVTVAVIVAMIVLVVIVSVIVYAFKTRRWCFAGSRDYTATGTGSRVDEEHPDDIVEQKEGTAIGNSLQPPRCADNQETMELQSFLETPISNPVDDSDPLNSADH